MHPLLRHTIPILSITSLILSSCRPPAATATTPTTSPAMPAFSTTPLGRFHLKLLLSHAITQSPTPLGTSEVHLKDYPPITIAEADFYLPAGPSPEGIAPLPDARYLLLKFTDLTLSPDHADARQFLFDANFQVQTALAPSSAWPFIYTSSSPSPRFPTNVPISQILSEFSNTNQSLSTSATLTIELTYLGLTSAYALAQKSSPPSLHNPLPPNLPATLQSDTQSLRPTHPSP